MNWRSFLSDLNLVWASLATVGAAVTAAFLAGTWLAFKPGPDGTLAVALTIAGIVVVLLIGFLAGHASAPGLRRALAEKDLQIGQLSASNEELKGQLRSPVATVKPLSLPDESVQVWLRTIEPIDVAQSLRPAPKPVLLIANLKGGVAKTMTAANLAAYFSRRGEYPRTSEQASKRVLLIDLDYQGSLTRLVLAAMKVGNLPQKTQVQSLFDSRISDEDALQYCVRTAGQFERLAFYPSEYGFDDFETREQFRWLSGEQGPDVRFALLRRLRSKPFVDAFDLVIIDTGPRLTTGSVAALAAASHLLVPTIAESRSWDSAQRFLRRVSVMKNGSVERPDLPRLCPNLKVLGVLPTLTGGHPATVNEQEEQLNALKAVVHEDPELRGLTPRDGILFRSRLARNDTIVRLAQAELSCCRFHGHRV